MFPKVSIIIPVYNVADFIADCLLSVYNQTYSDIEVVIVDDCSPDHSLEVAKPYIQLLRERFLVSIIRHGQNKGLSAARNSGIKAMHGQWMYFLDSDDEITSDCIELLYVKTLKYPLVDFVIGGMKVTGANWVFELHMPEYSDTIESVIGGYIEGKWYVMACNKLIRREFLINKNLWFKEGLLHEDELFSFQLAFAAPRMSCVFKNIYIYKVRNNTSITADRTLKNLEHQLKIILFEYNYILKQINIDSCLPIAQLLINHTYQYVVAVAGNKSITQKKKKGLLFTLFDSFIKLQPYCKKIDSWKLKTKKMILTLPVETVIRIARIHFRFRNK